MVHFFWLCRRVDQRGSCRTAQKSLAQTPLYL
jgi:hypothetical protein